MARHFTPDVFAFLRDLAANNDRAWFTENKQRYEDSVRQPALDFITDFVEPLETLSPYFVADSRTVALTRDGERMLGYARRMLALNEEAVETIGGPAIAGPLRIGASDVSSFVLPAVLTRLAEGYPRLEIEIVCDRSWAEMPVEMPSRASMETVNAV